MASDDRLLDTAEAFIGPDIALFSLGYILKCPEVGQPVLWHQDGSYWPLEPLQAITLYVAISEATPANGCLRVIPGTQRLPPQPLVKRTDVENFLRSSIDESLIDETQAIDLILKPGDVSIHNTSIVHGSSAWTGDSWRLSLVINYIPTSTRIKIPNFKRSFLLRGRPVEGVDNTYQPYPRYIAGRHMPFAGCEKWE
jgi:ectoine hydroxylase-related dioxygenase (phytanoyl-CoA dioxygenase family)